MCHYLLVKCILSLWTHTTLYLHVLGVICTQRSIFASSIYTATLGSYVFLVIKSVPRVSVLPPWVHTFFPCLSIRESVSRVPIVTNYANIVILGIYFLLHRANSKIDKDQELKQSYPTTQPQEAHTHTLIHKRHAR